MLTEEMLSHGFVGPGQSQGNLKLSVLHSVMPYEHQKKASWMGTKEYPRQKLIWGRTHLVRREPKCSGGCETRRSLHITRELTASFRSTERPCTVGLQIPSNVGRSYSGKGPELNQLEVFQRFFQIKKIPSIWKSLIKGVTSGKWPQKIYFKTNSLSLQKTLDFILELWNVMAPPCTLWYLIITLLLWLQITGAYGANSKK